MIIIESKPIILKPEKEYKYITNGVTYSKCVYLGKNDSIENWYDTNDEPYTPNSETEEKE